MKKLRVFLFVLVAAALPALQAVTKHEFIREVVRQTGGPRPDEALHFNDVIDELWGTSGDLSLRSGRLRMIILGVADISWCSGLTVSSFCKRFLELVRGYGGTAASASQPQQTFNSRECGICFAPYAWNAKKFVLACQHAFHEGCIVRWLVVQQLGLCPFCRVPFSPGEKIAVRSLQPGVYAGFVCRETQKRYLAEREMWQQYQEEFGWHDGIEERDDGVALHECDSYGSAEELLTTAVDDNENNNYEI